MVEEFVEIKIPQKLYRKVCLKCSDLNDDACGGLCIVSAMNQCK